MKTKNVVGAIAAVSAALGLALNPAYASSADQKLNVSLWGQPVMRSHGGAVPFAEDTSIDKIIESGPGKQRALGAEIGVNIGKGWSVEAGYSDHRLKNDSLYDTDPTESNDCNVLPVQGILTDCVDRADFKTKTKTKIVDLSIGKRFKAKRVTIVPFVGVRRISFDQKMDAEYLYNGGNEEFANRKIKYSGQGPRAGIKMTTPIGKSGYYVKTDLAAAKMLSGKRKQSINHIETTAGIFSESATAAESINIKPVIFDGSLVLGYGIARSFRVEVGYRYSQLSGLLDTRDTANPPTGGEIPGERGLGSQKKPLQTSGVYLGFSWSL